MNQFKALRFHRLGMPAEVLQLEDVLSTEPGEGEVRIQVHAFALNRADWLYANGWHYSQPELPARIGSECAGIVVATGHGVDPGLLGKSVCTVPFDNCRYGVQGEFADVPVRYLAPWPKVLTAEQAAAIWMQYLTAYFALLSIARIGPGDHVLVAAGSSSAGLAAIQLAKHAGATVLATSRSLAKASSIKKAGADHVLSTGGDTDLAPEINALTAGQGIRAVYDPIGGDFMQRYSGALASKADIFLYGLLSGEPTKMDLVPLVRAHAIVRPYSMFNHVCEPTELAAAIDYISKAIDDGVRPIIDKVFDWPDALSAYRHMDSHSQVGKIVVKVC